MGPQRLWEGKSGQLEGPGWAGAWRDPPPPATGARVWSLTAGT